MGEGVRRGEVNKDAVQTEVVSQVTMGARGREALILPETRIVGVFFS